MVHLRSGLTPAALAPKLCRLFELSAAKIRSLEKSWPPARGAPVFTVRGQYTSRDWTEWTQGFNNAGTCETRFARWPRGASPRTTENAATTSWP
jgi:hypothetical protein